jgi:DNA-directed RNA polymerase subunit RPC12/RpoP
MADTTSTTTTGNRDQQPVMLCDGRCESCSVPYIDERDNGEPVSCAYCGEPIDLKGQSVTARRALNS